MRTVLTNEALEKTLSRERLRKYLEAANQNLHAAIGLYEKNTRISEAFYTPLQCMEICLRNCLNYELTNEYSEDWFRDPQVPLNNDSRRMIFDAVEELKRERRDLSPGKVIAELKFSFWVGLLGPQYDSPRRAAVSPRSESIERIRPAEVHAGSRIVSSAGWEPTASRRRGGPVGRGPSILWETGRPDPDPRS